MIEPVQTIALPSSLDALAIGVGAISGALHARRRNMDVMGILVVAFCAALGGGVIRDILLASGPPVFLTSSVFLIYALVGATFGWLFSRYASRATILMEVIDGLFIGVWVLVGATKALSNGLGFGSAILVAVITATGGGVLRDLFSGEPVGLLRPGHLAGRRGPGGRADLHDRLLDQRGPLPRRSPVHHGGLHHPHDQRRLRPAHPDADGSQPSPVSLQGVVSTIRPDPSTRVP
jgi:uncharacterized membrane protein YeiH